MPESEVDERAPVRPLRLHGHSLDNVLVVRVAGEIDLATAPELREGIRESLDLAPGGLVIIDLTAVTFLGSAGLAALLEATKHAQTRADRWLRIVVGRNNPRVQDPMDLTGLTPILMPYPTLEAALNPTAIRQRPSGGLSPAPARTATR